MTYGNSLYGGTLYAGELESETPPPVPVPAIVAAPVRGTLGCGEWTAQIVGRGGSPVLYEAPLSSGSVSYPSNATGNASISIGGDEASWSQCCEVIRRTEPLEHELVLYRDEALRFAGPVIEVTSEDGRIAGRDLSYWMEVRFLDDLHADGDSADVFRAVFDNAYDKDTSPSIALTTRLSGIQTSIDVREEEFRRASDILRSLSSYGIDWTVIGRTILAGGQEVFEGGGDVLVLHDEGVSRANLVKEGISLATDMAVFGSRGNQAETPVTGRATIGIERYGLVQRSITDLLIVDKVAADAEAFARLQAMQPSPRRVTATLSEIAGFNFSDLVPGRRMDVRLYDSLGCGQVDEVMRLQEVNVEFGDTEEVTITLVPLGVEE